MRHAACGMRIVVTGGAGSVGSHLCDFLLDRGAAVVGMTTCRRVDCRTSRTSSTARHSSSYVDDTVRRVVAMIDPSEPGPIDLGNPDERTVLELTQVVLQLTGSSSRVEYRPLPVDDPTRRRRVITRARQRM